MKNRLALTCLALLLTQTQGIAQQDVKQSSSRTSGGMLLQNIEGDDVLRVEKMVGERLRAGDTFEYKIKVSNVTSTPVQGIVVHERFGGDLKLSRVSGIKPATKDERKASAKKEKNSQAAKKKQASKSNKDSESKNEKKAESATQSKSKQNQGIYQGAVRYQIGTLKPGESEIITVAASAKQAGQINSCMWLDYNQNSTMCSTLEIIDPELELTAELEVERDLLYTACEEIDGFYTCDDLRLIVTVKNPGEGNTPAAELNVQLPEGLKIADKQNSKSSAKMNLGKIDAGESTKHVFDLEIVDPTAVNTGSEVSITATAGDLKAHQKDDLKLKVLQPKLDVVLRTPSKHYADSPATYVVEVTNPSSAPVVDARLIIQQPEAANRFTINGGDFEEGQLIKIGCLKPGEKKTYGMEIGVNEPTDLKFLVKADAYCIDAVEKTVESEVLGIPAILIETVDKVDPVPVGSETVYEIAVKNQGSAKDMNINLVGHLPEELEFIEASGETEVKQSDGELTFGKLDELKPGDVATWYVRAKAKSPANSRFKLELTSQANEKTILEEEPTHLFESKSARTSTSAKQ